MFKAGLHRRLDATRDKLGGGSGIHGHSKDEASVYGEFARPGSSREGVTDGVTDADSVHVLGPEEGERASARSRRRTEASKRIQRRTDVSGSRRTTERRKRKADGGSSSSERSDAPHKRR